MNSVKINQEIIGINLNRFYQPKTVTSAKKNQGLFSIYSIWYKPQTKRLRLKSSINQGETLLDVKTIHLSIKLTDGQEAI